MVFVLPSFHISVSVLLTLMLCRPDSNHQKSMKLAAEQPEPERMWRKMWRQHFWQRSAGFWPLKQFVSLNTRKNCEGSSQGSGVKTILLECVYKWGSLHWWKEPGSTQSIWKPMQPKSWTWYPRASGSSGSGRWWLTGRRRAKFYKMW